MTAARCWGIFRERTHSPGREGDDAEILRLTAKHLQALGFDVDLKAPDEIDASPADWPPFVFLMCERPEVIDRLRAMQAAGARLVNSPDAVLNTYRERMIVRLGQAGVPFISSRVVGTTGGDDGAGGPVWVKRADVHNTQAGDVAFASTRVELRAALDGLAARGIPRAVIQPHVEGDLIKFYGIGERPDGAPSWFRWFHHRDQVLAGHPVDASRLARIVGTAARALELEIYGGDAIATAGGDLVLLDVNAWPSFALYRDEAAVAIAGHLALRFAGEAP